MNAFRALVAGKTEVLGGKPVTIPLCPLKILTESNPNFYGDRQAINHLRLGTKYYRFQEIREGRNLSRIDTELRSKEFRHKHFTSFVN